MAPVSKPGDGEDEFALPAGWVAADYLAVLSVVRAEDEVLEAVGPASKVRVKPGEETQDVHLRQLDVLIVGTGTPRRRASVSARLARSRPSPATEARRA